MAPPRNQLTGMLGIYLVAAELTSRDFIVAPTPSNTTGVDLFVADQLCRRAWTIQVSTNRRAASSWLLGGWTRDLHSDSHIHVFVNLHGDKRPSYYVVASRTVVEQMKPTANRTGSSVYEFARERAQPHTENWMLFGPPT